MAKAKPNTNPETEQTETEQTETEQPETEQPETEQPAPAESKAQAAAETLQFRTASGATFWRCGVQFDGAWQPLNRADFDDAQWARLLDEPMLQHQGA
ncbi:hypothetical protein [Kingella denitrificans]|uniref:hypothetical protein n=1 Tax=Kingella denitrificans TaxID=502 RepID=UPI002889B764|nr:hypothetical protein [Kingella denitrificans]